MSNDTATKDRKADEVSESTLNDLLSDFSQGVCEDGAAILKDGEQMTIEQILFELRCGDRARIALRPRIWDRSINELWHINLPDVIKSFDALRKWAFGTERYKVYADHPILARPGKVGMYKDEAEEYAAELLRLGYENIKVSSYR